MRRRIGHKISPRIHVIEKVRDGDWLMLSIQRDIEKARARRKQNAHLYCVRRIRIAKRRR